jgi:hypothetical protein
MTNALQIAAVRLSFRRLLFLAAVGMVLCVMPALAQQQPPQKFWVAARYDGDRIVVFFDAVQLTDVPASARTLPIAAALGFLWQKELPPDYVAKLPRKPDAEKFQLGDQYDVLLGDGRIAVVTLTTLVGYVSDDDDDPSYIGALGKVEDPTGLVGPRLYYALQRHDPSNPAFKQKRRPAGVSAALAARDGTFAYLINEPLRFDQQTRIASLLGEKLRASLSVERRQLAEKLVPKFSVQAFRLATGPVRYYARAEWRADGQPEGPPEFAFAAWLVADPDFRILASEDVTSPDDGFLYELPNLLNVVDLGAGRTGIILNIPGPYKDTLGLWEYRDGADLTHMHLFQSIASDN